ncbi:uncharacterized protein LOC126653981 [Mercurialis annua]|uniref:uncharacterized protein LOC126653981 n=1 Tax=Mercurialis annua TaxID=3986 RepID=UPI00215ED663|nr:uncharacterized protein LOC126653981 [Mercurialis annua]
MMKKMKRVPNNNMAMAESSSLSPYASVYEDPRTRLKFQSLLQDFHELNKETDSQRKQLQMMKEKKSTLSAEIRFLRRRYTYLMQKKSQNPDPEPKHVLKQNLVNGSKIVRKEKRSTGNDASVQRSVSGFDLNRKGKVYSEREPTLRSPALNFDRNQKQKSYIRKEATMRNSAAIPDLNQKERIYSGKEAAAVRNNTPIFDLNQISREEEELQANGEMMRSEEPKICLIRGASDEQLNDLKLSACRNIGNGSSRTGKRKISWQDQVALRV